jgi:hypothetical protein
MVMTVMRLFLKEFLVALRSRLSTHFFRIFTSALGLIAVEAVEIEEGSLGEAAKECASPA